MTVTKADEYLVELDRILSEPLSAVRDREKSVFDTLLAGCGNRLVFFGAGNLGRKALQCVRSIGVEPLAFADNSQSKWGSNVDGVPVLSPKDAAARYGASALFLVTIWSLGHSYPESRAMLERMGCTHVESTASLRWKFADRLLPDFCQDLPHKLYEQAAEVRKAASLWADDSSRQEYLNHLKWRALGDQNALGPPVKEESYFLDSLYCIDDHEVFVDCGAYTGDTAEQVIRRNPAFSRIIAIEADPENFDRLTKWVGTLEPPVASRIDALNVAVGAKRGQLRFQAGGGEGAKLAADGNVVVECVPIDDLATEAGPTFIKMDIEGAELDALEGARRSIQTHRPILSICVYHKQNDLWRIPLFIHTLVEDYRLFLRPHDVDGWQLVCYAVPANRLRSEA
ncbi:MAG TPA: FkbM family methyltransferase [Candidatus Sulfotelmatobacter sp.]|nr:FkbM family methyltransferase [Candidatus Sulfotelmatobacter sp.]